MMPVLSQVETIKPAFTVAELHEHAIAYAEARFAEKGEVLPVWIVDDGRNLVWVETVWANENEKVASIEFMRLLMHSVEARAYTQISEVYWASIGKDQSRDELPESLADLPKNQRDEALLVMTSDHGGVRQISRFLITHPAKGSNFLGPRVDERGGKWSGRMFNLLAHRASQAEA